MYWSNNIGNVLFMWRKMTVQDLHMKRFPDYFIVNLEQHL